MKSSTKYLHYTIFFCKSVSKRKCLVAVYPVECAKDRFKVITLLFKYSWKYVFPCALIGFVCHVSEWTVYTIHLFFCEYSHVRVSTSLEMRMSVILFYISLCFYGSMLIMRFCLTDVRVLCLLDMIMNCLSLAIEYRCCLSCESYQQESARLA